MEYVRFIVKTSTQFERCSQARLKSFKKGTLAEEMVAELMAAQGWRLVVRNFRARGCELDLVATKKSCLSFVEVKYRKFLPRYPTELDLGLSFKKKRALVRGSLAFFLKWPELRECQTWRFDHAFVTENTKGCGHLAEIHYFASAFDPYSFLASS